MPKKTRFYATLWHGNCYCKVCHKTVKKTVKTIEAVNHCKQRRNRDSSEGVIVSGKMIVLEGFKYKGLQFVVAIVNNKRIMGGKVEIGIGANWRASTWNSILNHQQYQKYLNWS